MTATRPLVRYHGGKWKLAPWIISHFPPHHTYVEPFGGGGSVLLRKPRAHGEVYNDLDGEMVNLFRVARDQGPELLRALELTPFARAEFALSYEPATSELEQARRTVVRSFQGFGSAAVNGQASGFRAASARSGNSPSQDWRNYPAALGGVIARLQGVVLENRDACEVMPQQDRAGTLHYVDPPYVHSTRSNVVERRGKSYRFELDDQQHRELATFLQQLRGMVVLSGYPSTLYRELYSGWTCMEIATHADGGLPRTECLWLNAAAACGQRQTMLALA